MTPVEIKKKEDSKEFRKQGADLNFKRHEKYIKDDINRGKLNFIIKQILL